MVSFTTLIACVAALASVSSAAPNRHGLHARHGHKLMNRQAYGYSNTTVSPVDAPTGTGSVSEGPVYVTSTIVSYTTTCVTLTYTLGGGRPVTTTITKTIPVQTITATKGGAEVVPHSPTSVAPGPVETAPTDEESSPVTPEEEDTSPVVPENTMKVVTVTETVTETESASQCACTETDETTVVTVTSTIHHAPTVTDSFAPQHTAGPKPHSSANAEQGDMTTLVTKTYSRPSYGHGPYYNGTHPGHPTKPSYGPGPVGPTGNAVLPSHAVHPVVPPQSPSASPEPSYASTVYVMPIYGTPSAAPSPGPSSSASPEQPQAPTYGRK